MLIALSAYLCFDFGSIVANVQLITILPGARPTKHISIEFEIRWKFRML